jgi:membrane protein implicated in regulation of membrane protease activity
MIELWFVWVIAAIVCFVVEIFTAELMLASVGLGCLGAGAAAFFGAPVNGQILAFILTTLALMFAVRPRLKRWLYRSGDPKPLGIDAYIGRQGEITEQVQGDVAPGRVRLGGEEWRAVSHDRQPIDAGERVEVVSVEAATLIVRRAKSST